MPISVLLADDHDILRQGLRLILEAHPDLVVLGEARDGAEAIELAGRLRPDVAVVDIGMKPKNGIEATAQIRQCSPGTAVLILTVYDDEYYVIRAVGAGARGYMLKESLEEEDLVRAIHTLCAGGRFFSPAIAGFVPAGGVHAHKAQ
jgi:DNA-binding NarL/FixJ family response regulator